MTFEDYRRAERESGASGIWCEPEDGEPFWWPFCEIAGCINCICVGRSDRFCWPHSDSGTTVAAIIENAKTTEAA